MARNLIERGALAAVVTASVGFAALPAESGAAASTGVRPSITSSDTVTSLKISGNCEIPGTENNRATVIALPQTEPVGYAGVAKIKADATHPGVFDTTPGAVVDLVGGRDSAHQLTLTGRTKSGEQVASVGEIFSDTTIQVRAGELQIFCLPHPGQTVINETKRDLGKRVPVDQVSVNSKGFSVSRRFPGNNRR